MTENPKRDSNMESENRPKRDPNNIQLASMLFGHIEDQLTLADTKAQLIIAADTLLAATTAFFLNRDAIARFFISTASILDRFIGAISLLLFAGLIISIYFALLAARPMLRLSGQRRSLFYFGHIAKLSEQDFTNEFLGQTALEIRESILAQAHAKAVIANTKYERVRRSIDFFIFGLILWVILQLAIAFQP